ncbi:MAG: SUMF1/EgtB/PvdO family nonheme iron enzyme [Methylacidiphilales bacterium]|nr:SUMF1/EgtB/PvdO family nonheme iron enzyme [Candidatus Methylacidiphilales bacterium]
MANHPFDAYHGREPYIFVSYSHKDGTEVFSEISRLNQHGYRIWYDEGIDPGNEWTEEIARALEGAAYFMVFISEDSVRSTNVRNEINFALNRGKPFLAIHLADIKLPSGLELRMADIQAIYRWQISDDQYYRKLERALLPTTKRGDTGEAEPASPKPAPIPASSGTRWWIGAGIAFLVLGMLGYYFGVVLPAERKSAEIAEQKTVSPAQQTTTQAKSDQENAPSGNVAPTPAPPTPATPPPPVVTPAPASGTAAGQSWTNSLGVSFVPAGTDGVLFSIWDVRVKDYAVFVKETGQAWPKTDFTQTDNDPAIDVSWDDANAFCAWLTKKEQAEGKLASNQEYRLPTDAEWSKAVGLNEVSGGTPEQESGKVQGVYPWGTEWPPPKGAGNYSESLTHDGYSYTSPVGSFAANPYGLYDMGGNVWQWCEDAYDNLPGYRVLRGAAWDMAAFERLLSSYRSNCDQGNRRGDNGFRLVMATSPTQP